MTEKDKLIVVLTTCPNQEVAGQLSRALVTEGLAACVNAVPGVASTYIWKGEVQTDQEVLLIVKSTDSRWNELQNRLLALHPYELPELVAIPVCAGAENYLAWVRENVKSHG